MSSAPQSASKTIQHHDTLEIRDLEVEPPSHSGRGRTAAQPYVQMSDWRAALSAAACKRLEVRDGEKGPLVVEAVTCRVSAKLGTSAGPEERLFIARELQSDGGYKHDYYFVHTGSVDAPMAEMAGWRKPSTGSKSAFDAARAMRVWATFRSGTGRAGTITWHCPSRRVVPHRGHASGGKNVHADANGSAFARPDRELLEELLEYIRPARTMSRDPLVAAHRIGTLRPVSRT